MISCVTIATNHHFPGNLLADQHRLRYREVVDKENWSDIYVVDNMEFDRYDNLATEYFIARNQEGKIVGVCRSYPTTIPYMLSEAFPFLMKKNLPSSPKAFEASRLVLDRSLLTKEQRRPVIDALLVAYMERGLQRKIDAYVGFMFPKIWSSTFQRIGWEIEWIGPPVPLPKTREVVRAGLIPVTESLNARIRTITGITRDILDFGNAKENSAAVAQYSHVLNHKKVAA
jgi:acyl-homoserine lactone synthase